MDEVREFCRRVLGPGQSAAAAVVEVRAVEHAGRIELLSAAAEACRSRDGSPAAPGVDGGPPEDLAAAVAQELAQATAALPERHREALVLRELLRLSHQQIAKVLGVEAAAVAPLLARARLGLRAERRGPIPETGPACPERDRSLRILTRRQDSEPIEVEDDDWLPEHLGSCEACRRAHAAMLEASVCYRAWPVLEPRSSAADAGTSAAAAPAG
jgi:hypothetical protein